MWTYGLTLLLIIGTGVWYWTSSQGAQEQSIYETEAISQGDLRVTVSATGTIEPTTLVEISSELSGKLENVLVDFNDTVTEGQVLATLDTTKLKAQVEVQRAATQAAAARVLRAEANLKQTAENYETTRQLDLRGITTHKEFIAAKTAYASAQADFEIAKADRELAGANLAMQQADLEKACICSPINGVVLNRSVDAGQIVASSLSAPVLFTIAGDLSKMELRVNVDEADIGRVAVSDRATFTVDAYEGKTFPAEVTKIRFVSETINGVVTYKIILNIQNDDLLLRPGMTATTEIIVAEINDAVLVPNAALRYAPPQIADPSDEDSSSGLLGLIFSPANRLRETGENSGKSIWVLRQEVAVEIPVVTGQTDGVHTQILSGDLTIGDLVITDQTDG